MRKIIASIYWWVRRSSRSIALYFIDRFNLIAYKLTGFHLHCHFLCAMYYRWFISSTPYYDKEINCQLVFDDISKVLAEQERGSRPFVLGPSEGHDNITPLPLIESMVNLPNRSYVFLWLYRPNNIQSLMRSKFGLVIEQLIGSRPFVYNIDVFRLHKSNGEILLDGLRHFTTASFGTCGFLVLTGEEGGGLDFRTIDIDRANARLTDFRRSDILLPGRGVEHIVFDSADEYVDLAFFHILPSYNKHITCQVAGFDLTGPRLPWKPKSGLPLLHIANKNKEYDLIDKGRIRGINLGGGDFYLEDWINFDTRWGYEKFNNFIPLWFSEKTVLPFEDESLDFVYTAHCFEHLDDQTVDNLLSESYRCLRKGGIMMIIVPDSQLALEDCRKGSWEFVRNWRLSDDVVWNFSLNNVDISLETLTTFMFAGTGNITTGGGHPGGRWIYHGPPKIARGELAEAIHNLDAKEFSRFANSHTPKDNHLYEHVNAFSKTELNGRLNDSGFTVVEPFGAEAQILRDILNREAEVKFKKEENRRAFF